MISQSSKGCNCKLIITSSLFIIPYSLQAQRSDYTYTGREYNREINQYYYRARTYVSSIGRFTGKDPWTWQPDDERLIGIILNDVIINRTISEFNKNNYYFYVDNNAPISNDSNGKGIINEIDCLRGKVQKYIGKNLSTQGKIETTIGTAGGITAALIGGFALATKK